MIYFSSIFTFIFIACFMHTSLSFWILIIYFVSLFIIFFLFLMIFLFYFDSFLSYASCIWVYNFGFLSFIYFISFVCSHHLFNDFFVLIHFYHMLHAHESSILDSHFFHYYVIFDPVFDVFCSVFIFHYFFSCSCLLLIWKP